jgi:hypothetical protein
MIPEKKAREILERFLVEPGEFLEAIKNFNQKLTLSELKRLSAGLDELSQQKARIDAEIQHREKAGDR